MLQKAQRVSLVEQVVMQIEQLIESKHWGVGDKLPPEMELMKQFDVSRNTLREAIHALVHAGLLETKQGSGTFVQSSSALGAAVHRHIKKSSLLDTLEVRLALEREAAELAAKHRTDADLNILQDCINQCQCAAKKGDIEKFISADIAFHKSIIKAAHNQLMEDLYEHMTDSLYASIRDVMIARHIDLKKEIHYELLGAIREKNTEEATRFVNEYIIDLKQHFS